MTELDKLRASVARAVANAERLIEIHEMDKERERICRETEEKSRQELIRLNQLKPYLEKLPENIAATARLGSRKVVINVSVYDFHFNSREDGDWKVLPKSPTATLIAFLTEMNMKAYPIENVCYPRFSVVVEF